MWVWYNVHLSSLSFLDRENSWTLLTGLLLHSIYTFFVITGTCEDFVRRTLIKKLAPPSNPGGGDNPGRAAEVSLGRMAVAPAA